MDGRIDEVAQRASGLSADDTVARVLAALEAGAPGSADPESFEVFRTAHHARALWTLHQCRRHCPDFAFVLVTAPFFCFGADHVIVGTLRHTRPRCDACEARDADIPDKSGCAADAPADAPRDSARLDAVLERLAGDTRDALVDAARALVASDAFADGAATLRAGQGDRAPGRPGAGRGRVRRVQGARRDAAHVLRRARRVRRRAEPVRKQRLFILDHSFVSARQRGWRRMYIHPSLPWPPTSSPPRRSCRIVPTF
jgi:hypothetical protein